MNAKTGLVVLIVASLFVGGFFLWRWGGGEKAAPPGFALANGRLEMTRIDVAAKYPGRLVYLDAVEGERATAGQILARQDPAELEARLAGAIADKARALAAIERAKGETGAREQSRNLAALEVREAERLRRGNLVSAVELERRQIALDAENAALSAARAAIDEGEAAAAAASAQMLQIKVALNDLDLRAPLDGRIEHRLVEQGAVVGAGGRVASLLDPADVYLVVFYPLATASVLKLGDEARIRLDGFAGAIPATVGFVAPEAQFTPKFVETREERQTLVYRVKLQIPKDAAMLLDGRLKAGMAGDGLVRLDPDAIWPDSFALMDNGHDTQ